MLNRIVITGAPGTGKTSLINVLKIKGYKCYDEYSRKIIEEGKKIGIKNFFLEKPKLFSYKIIKGREKQYKESLSVKKSIGNLIFFDRGIYDVYAYLHSLNKSYVFPEKKPQFDYHKIFILKPWKSIYKNDSERIEKFNFSLKIDKSIRHTYKKYGFKLINVPKTTVKERIKFILEKSI